ncbi:hypothetical protein ASPWEDRAFT_171524 [Aspergillus wentii DTO 134E9]|uniref:Uncharacterized protein n=1 Tax=Aspergillus wentii DTO 134E9 TaxID=1073089 RepID=A0A1L9RID6_ASPWE|nr:uncharacterized protein ASPWEDRAFT_171524 [Aspergillus wentii DTO 134E9]OJJ34685.1 hypothetical protein ASPWEDRAFT_171524 [Aspergillus wentii DTO 134E9]
MSTQQKLPSQLPDLNWHKLSSPDKHPTRTYGVTLYADIFRRVNTDTEKAPAIIPWSSYGKTGSGTQHVEVIMKDSGRSGRCLTRTGRVPVVAGL